MGDWLREQRRLGALARALLGHAAAGLALRATGARPLSSAPSTSSRSSRRAPGGPAPALRRRGRLPLPAVRRADAARARGHRRLVRLGRMPFAQDHAPFENEERFQARFPADFICEALDQTRGWFYSLLAVGDAAVRPRARTSTSSASGCSSTSRARRCRSRKGNIVVPWDVIDRYGADAFRWYFFTSKQPWDGYRFSSRRSASRCGCSCAQLWNAYALPRPLRAPTATAASRPTSTAGSCRGWRRRSTRSPSAWTPTTPPPPAARSRTSSTTSATGTCAARGGASGRATRAAFDDAARVPADGRSCSRRSRRSSPTRSTTSSTAASRRSTCPTGRQAGTRDPELEDDDGGRARGGAARPGGARAGEGQVRQPLREAVVVAAGRERAAIERLADVVARSST